MLIKEMICVLYRSRDFITLEQWNCGCLSVDVHINTCIKAVSWQRGLHEPHIIMSTDEFPKQDLHGACHKVSFLDATQETGDDPALSLYMDICMQAGTVLWRGVSAWLGTLKAS